MSPAVNPYELVRKRSGDNPHKVQPRPAVKSVLVNRDLQSIRVIHPKTLTSVGQFHIIEIVASRSPPIDARMDTPKGATVPTTDLQSPATEFSIQFSPPSQSGSISKISGTVPSVKRKREKYTGKACGPCKIRKIKVSSRKLRYVLSKIDGLQCGGGTPCPACVRRKRPCTMLESDHASKRRSGEVEFRREHSECETPV